MEPEICAFQRIPQSGPTERGLAPTATRCRRHDKLSALTEDRAMESGLRRRVEWAKNEAAVCLTA
jgi:hypothetical protein